MPVLIFSKLVWNISHSKKNWSKMCIGLPVKYLLYSSDFNELERSTFF